MDPELLVIATIGPGEQAPGPYVDYQAARQVTAVLDLPEFRRFVRREATAHRVPVVGLAHDWFGASKPRRRSVLMTCIDAREANKLRRKAQPANAA